MGVKAMLVAVDHASGRGGVVIDTDGDIWLTGSLERLGGTRLDDYRPAHEGLDGDRTVLGGRLPSGAIFAEAVNDRGARVGCEVRDGAWAVVLDQPIWGPVSPVCFRDAGGAPVAASLPADWAR